MTLGKVRAFSGRAGERPDWRIATVGVLATLIMLCLPALAMGAITVGQRIDGVKLGDTEAHVRAVLGKPSYCEPCGKRDLVWGFQKTLVGRVGFDPHGHANGMWTASPTQATSKGIHPSGLTGKPRGSSLTQAKKAYPHAKCTLGPKGPGSTLCELRSRYHGRTVLTDFLLQKGYGVIEIDVDYASAG
jgi:hypothetical protein